MLIQTSQEPRWLLHCSITPLSACMCFGSPPQIAKHALHMQEGPWQPPATRWHCCLCPSSHAQHVHCTRGLVARMGWAAEPEICANRASPQNPPHEQEFHMGKNICRKEGGGMLAPPPQPVWRRGHQDSSRFYHEVHAQVFCYYRNPVPLTMWAAAQLFQSKLSGKMPGSLPAKGSNCF